MGTVVPGLYSDIPLNEVVAPPPGLATRLCFSVEYRHSTEQLTVSLLRLSNLPPRFHGNVTLVELRLLPEERRSRQAKARCTGPDPEFSHSFIFQASSQAHPKALKKVCVCVCVTGLSCTGVSSACVSEHTECVCAEHAAGRETVGCGPRPLPSGRRAWSGWQGPLEGPGDGRSHAGTPRTWPEPVQNRARTHSNTCGLSQSSELGDVQISLCYSPALQRLYVVVLRARGLQTLPDAGLRLLHGPPKHLRR